ncbi:serine/threonine-protein kinase [Dyella silvae]|uniref:serine/threonine-protein kinase n=1 Tax=Dyella silvae TaxID=2994424 RepID=UPI0022645E53|nr:serine/threonine-protein kinase [Dyella silvae]
MIAEFAQRWPEIEPLIDQLFDVPAAERTDWLHKHCGDATLRALVAQALDHAAGNEALERGMAQWLPGLADDVPEGLPSIAGYRVLRFVGSGGMASVFEAERELPGGPQTVALKLLRIDVHDAEERGRFLREQRILARLQHPHIAQLLDAGFSPTGTPFLALEFVAGDDIVRHCEQRGLGMRERLALFIDVCAAVEHAHRSLIVHRDLKPSNVLVGADGCVKLVDFGIAKLLTGDGERTRTEARRLTRLYAAPEQFSGDTATTAIDVYALGVLLTELICGQKPRRDSQNDAEPTSSLDSHVLRKRLGIDLHAIVQEATRQHPNRRYASVSALSADVQRFLDGKPLQVRADTLAYRVFTFARRHTFAVSTAAVAALMLSGATIAGLHEAHLARRAAQDAHMQAMSAKGEARRADALKIFLEGLFDSASPETKGTETIEQLLAVGRERADRDFAMQPALRVEIIALIGDLERRSGHPDRALRPLEEAAALAKTQFGAGDRRTLHVQYLLAKELDELGRVHEATAGLQSAVSAFQSGPNPHSPEEVQALAWIAGLDERSGDSAKAIEIGQQALTLARRVLPDDSDALTEAVLNFGWLLMDAGHPEPAVPLLREALARKRSHLGARHGDVADTMDLLAQALMQSGRYSESEQLLRDAVSMDTSVYGRPNAHTAWHLNDLANVLAFEDRFNEAEALYDQSMAIDLAVAPAADLTQAVSIGNLARLRFAQGDYVGAEAGYRDAIARKQRLLGADYGDNNLGYDKARLAEILIARGRLDESAPLVNAAVAEERRRYRDAHPDTAFALMIDAELMAASGDHHRAADLCEEAVAMYTALDDQRTDKAIRARLLLGDLWLSLGRNVEAKSQLEAVLSTLSTITPAPSALMAYAKADLARIDASLGDVDAATRLHTEARALLSDVKPGPNADRDAATHLLASAGTERHEPAGAMAIRRQPHPQPPR